MSLDVEDVDSLSGEEEGKGEGWKGERIEGGRRN